MKRGPKLEPLEARIARSFVRKGDDECWPWTGTFGWGGYGVLWLGRHVRPWRVPAHRFLFERSTGEKIPEGLQACHHCDNPQCVNPAHIFLGTIRDNAADRDAKGRNAKGVNHGFCKLTINQIIEIRSSYRDRRKFTDGAGCHELARRFGVTASAISNIVNGKTHADSLHFTASAA